jgi:hypothetical protein
MMDPVLQFVMRYSLALLWMVALVHKVQDVPRFAATAADYKLVPATFAGSTAFVVIMLECSVMLALLILPLHPAGPLGSAALLTVYGSAIAVNLARGRHDIDCGCIGPHARQKLGGWLVWRNLLLALVSLACLLPVSSRELLWLDNLTTMAAVSVLAGLYVIVSRLFNNIDAIARLRH